MYEDQREGDKLFSVKYELRFIFGNEKNGGAVPKPADSEIWNKKSRQCRLKLANFDPWFYVNMF